MVFFYDVLVSCIEGGQEEKKVHRRFTYYLKFRLETKLLGKKLENYLYENIELGG